MKNSLCKIRDNELYSRISPIANKCQRLPALVYGLSGRIEEYQLMQDGGGGNDLYSKNHHTGYIVTFSTENWLYGSMLMDTWLYSCLSPGQLAI